MFQLPITSDKIYTFLFIAIGLTLVFIFSSWYVKSCVKDEINDLKRDKKKEQYNKRQELLQIRQKQSAEIQNEHIDQDLDSYVDPVGKEHDTHQQYQDLNDEYKSPAEDEEYDPKNTILMRDIIDNKGHN